MAEDAFGFIVEQMLKLNPEKEGDYEVDGILHCGTCKEAKREWERHDGHLYLVPRDCKCIRDEREAEERKRENERHSETVYELRRASMIAEIFRTATFENYVKKKDNARVFTACRKYTDNFERMKDENQGLLFYGDVGTGKTYAAACIANALIEKEVGAVMISLAKLLQPTRSFEDEGALMSLLIYADLLIIDDLGVERSTDYGLERVYNLVDERYRSKRPVIVTTNLSLEEMKGCTDSRYMRIYDRIFEMCYPIKFSGVSKRKVEAKNRYDRMTRFFGEEEV